MSNYYAPFSDCGPREPIDETDDLDICGRCNGTGEISQAPGRHQTCPVCHGSTLSGRGEAKLAQKFCTQCDDDGEVTLATDGSLCAAHHDSAGERQDARDAEGI